MAPARSNSSETSTSVLAAAVLSSVFWADASSLAVWVAVQARPAAVESMTTPSSIAGPRILRMVTLRNCDSPGTAQTPCPSGGIGRLGVMVEPMSTPKEVPVIFGRRAATLPAPDQALPGRPAPTFKVPEKHAVLGTPIAGPVPNGMAEAFFGMGCFWGAERRFWQLPGVYSTAVGYQGGTTPNPTYAETCTGMTGHTEAVRVVYDPAVVSYGDLLKVFWET